MNDKPTPHRPSLDPTPDEQKLLLQLRGNPLLGLQFRSIANNFEDEIANGMDAHQAEIAMIEALQQLGKSMMHQWAENTQRDIIAQTTDLQKHSKKNSDGIPPSE
jgi:hypothetical protein